MTSNSVIGLATASASRARTSQLSAAAGDRTAATPSTDPAQVAAHAALFAGVTSPAALDAFATFLTGRTSTTAFWAATGSSTAAGTLPSPALAGVTFDKDGVPDFSAITTAGGKVTGALPPDGQSVVIWDIDGRRTVQYAVEIDRGDGSQPVYLKGVNVNGDSSVDRAGRADALACAAKLLSNDQNLWMTSPVW